MVESYNVGLCATILTVSGGQLKIVVSKEWQLSKNELQNCVNLDILIKGLLNSLGFYHLYIEQVKADYEDGKILIHYFALTNDPLDYPLLEITEDFKYAKIMKEILDRLSLYLDKREVLKYLFKETFTLPELLHVYEKVTKRGYDRRNFRKKLIKSGMIEEARGLNFSKTGRPAKLYQFKEGDDLYE